MTLFGGKHKENGSLRPPAVAGSFYPGDPEVLRETVVGLLAQAQAAPRGDIRAVIAPHAGYIYSGPVAAQAFAPLQALRGRVRRLVVIGPSHFVAFRGIAVPRVRAFRTPLGDMPVDAQAIARLASLPQVVEADEPHEGEHALEVELPFLQALFGPLPIVPLVVGRASAEEVAQVLDALWDADTRIVVSSDLSHYLDYESARQRDARTAAAIERLDEAAIGPEDACGALPLRGLLQAARRRGYAVERLDLRNSGDTAGERNRVVGYGAWAVTAG
ncbi:MAG: AmmeMemoRadiSam system protein B [Methyloligellaceae bacterium]